MPKISWEEISDLKHILWSTEIKLAKHGLMDESEYIRGVIDMLDRLTLRHEEDK